MSWERIARHALVAALVALVVLWLLRRSDPILTSPLDAPIVAPP